MMKSLLTCAMVIAFGATTAFAQTATTAPATTDTKQVEVAAPVIKAVEAEQGVIKCTGTGSCCNKGANRTSAITAPAAEGTVVAPDAAATPEAAAAATGEVNAEAPGSCHQVSIGVSAAKPVPAEPKEEPKK